MLAVPVRTPLSAFEVVDPIERGRRTDGRRTDGLPSDIADELDAEYGLHLFEQRFERDGRLWSRPQVGIHVFTCGFGLADPPTLH
jgi:hypothetical protein